MGDLNDKLLNKPGIAGTGDFKEIRINYGLNPNTIILNFHEFFENL